jgi:metallo-beta-lactamase class B
MGISWQNVENASIAEGLPVGIVQNGVTPDMRNSFAYALFLICSSALIILQAQAKPEWSQPFPPHQVMGNLYYVGSKGLASYVVKTPEGLILLNSNLENSPALIEQSLAKLGMRLSDVKILLISHAHWDHCAGSARLLALTKAKYMVMDADLPVIESGGKADFQYGHDKETHFPVAKVDRVLHDGSEVTLGGVTLTAHLTPGHTKGCTTWTTKIADQGKTYNVVIVGSPNVNAGYRLTYNQQYPQIAQDYERTFRVLKSLSCDIFLGAHGEYYGMEAKFRAIGKSGANPFVDPQGYRAYVADREKAFLSERAKQTAAGQKTAQNKQ